jgi:hypothetical protein
VLHGVQYRPVSLSFLHGDASAFPSWDVSYCLKLALPAQSWASLKWPWLQQRQIQGCVARNIVHAKHESGLFWYRVSGSNLCCWTNRSDPGSASILFRKCQLAEAHRRQPRKCTSWLSHTWLNCDYLLSSAWKRHMAQIQRWWQRQARCSARWPELDGESPLGECPCSLTLTQYVYAVGKI